MITLYLHARVRPGNRQALRDFLTEARKVYEAPGGIHVRLQWNRTDPDAFAEIIEYDDESTFAADDHRINTDPHLIELLGRWHALLDGPPQVTVFEEWSIPHR